jgi:putative ABC transport system permease protein
MVLTPLFRKAVADVTRRKLRTVLVVAGITVGIAGLTAINFASSDFYAAFAYSSNERETAEISLFVRDASASSVADLRSVPNVSVVQMQTLYRTRWKVSASPGHVNMLITAYSDFSAVKLFPFQLNAGHLPGRGEIVMESGDRALQNFQLGDVVTITTGTGPFDLRVSGLARTLGVGSPALNSRAIAYMSADGLAAATGVDQPNDVEIKVIDPKRTHETAQMVSDRLRQDSVTVLDTNINDNFWDPSPANGLFTVLRVLSGVALLLAAFLLINTITTLVGEQVGVIGIMKAMGADRLTVMRSYLTTVAVYAVIGTSLGLVLGLVAGYELALFLSTLVVIDLGPFHIDPTLLLLGVGVGLGVPFLAAIWPLWSGTRITVREALSAYGVSTGANRRLPAPPWIPQSVLLGVRSLTRRRGRALVTMIALTFSAASFLAIQTTTYSFNALLGHVFGQYDADVFVYTSQPEPYQDVRALLLSDPNVGVVERIEFSDAKTDWGTILLTGLEDNPTLYKRSILSGRWFAPGEQRVLLINQSLQRKSGLGPGDEITISNATKSESWQIIGTVHDLNGGLGTAGIALASSNQLNTFLRRPIDYASGFMVGARDRSQAAVDATANRLDDALTRAGLGPVVTTAQQNIQRNQSQFQILYALLYAVAAIVALVGILAVFNTLTTSVLERRREIGILRSLGATGSRVAIVFWAEGITLSLTAWVLAVLLGIPGAYAFVALISQVLANVPFAFNPVALVMMLAFTLLIATLASVVPAVSASRLRVVDVIRYE